MGLRVGGLVIFVVHNQVMRDDCRQAWSAQSACPVLTRAWPIRGSFGVRCRLCWSFHYLRCPRRVETRGLARERLVPDRRHGRFADCFVRAIERIGQALALSDSSLVLRRGRLEVGSWISLQVFR